MIAKRITSKAVKPRAARLVKYMVAAEGKLDPRSWTRTADYVLCSGTSTRGEKVGGVRVTNCNTNDPAAATTLIEATQAANTRSKTDKTYHLVFSFPPGEEPDLKTLHKIEDELVSSIGYAEHQRISAVHIDTDHLHVHVAINKVHPKGFQNIEPYYDKKKLMETCERLEIEYGLTRTNHGLDGREPKIRIAEKQAQAEAHSGLETIASVVTKAVAPALKEAKYWEQVHTILAEYDLEIKLRGAGLVIGSGKTWIKASQCDRGLSFKAMTDRLGPFEPGPNQRKEFTPKPKQNHPSSALLFEQYNHEQLARKKAREQSMQQLKYESAMRDHQLKKWYVAQKAFVRLTPPGLKRKAMLKVVNLQTEATRRMNWNAGEQKRCQLYRDTITLPWPGWLAQQAEWGNTEALAVLRSREERTKMRGDYLTAEKTGDETYITPDNLRFDVDRNGDVTYKASDGGIVIDRAKHIQCFKTTARSTELALEIALQRFKGQTLIVEGQENFQKEIAMLAARKGIKIQLSNPEIKPVMPKEKKRQKTTTKEAEL